MTCTSSFSTIRPQSPPLFFCSSPLLSFSFSFPTYTIQQPTHTHTYTLTRIHRGFFFLFPSQPHHYCIIPPSAVPFLLVPCLLSLPHSFFTVVPFLHTHSASFFFFHSPLTRHLLPTLYRFQLPQAHYPLLSASFSIEYMQVSTPVPHINQVDNWDCGLACVAMVANALGSRLSLAEVTLHCSGKTIFTTVGHLQASIKLQLQCLFVVEV